MSDATAVTTVEPARSTLPAPTFGARMELATLANAIEFAKIVHASGLAPKGLGVEGIVVAMQMGYEVGLSPLQAIQNIASINGRPAIWGDAQLALVRASGLLEWIKEETIGEPGTDGRGFRVTVKRVGQPEASDEFCVSDAKRAGLWGKQGPWTQYPQRMLRFRARGFILRDQFGDVLKGLRSAEEVMDEPREVDITATATDAPAPGAGEKLRQKRAKAAEAAPAATTAADAPRPATEPAASPAAMPEPATAEAPSETKLVSVLAAIDSTRTPRGLAVAYLQSIGRLEPMRGLDGLTDQATMRSIHERPADFARAVSEWESTRTLMTAGDGQK